MPVPLMLRCSSFFDSISQGHLPGLQIAHGQPAELLGAFREQAPERPRSKLGLGEGVGAWKIKPVPYRFHVLFWISYTRLRAPDLGH